MSAKPKILYMMVLAGGVALAQTANQTNNTNQAPKAPGQLTNANAEPTPVPNGNPGLTGDPHDA